MINVDRGSEWRRWDLHVHSPLSILNNQFPKVGGVPDWDKYITALEAQPIAVYGITDYFTIDGYKELLKRQAAGHLKGKTLLPNIEFRLDHILSSRHDGKRNIRLNMHVIFSNEVSVEDIEDHFLHDLNFVYEDNPTDTSEELALKPANLTRLGERLIKDHKTFAGTPPIEVGASKAVVSARAIQDLLKKDSRFRNKYLLILAADGWDNIGWDGQDHQVRKTLLQASAMVFSSSAKTATWCVGDGHEGGPEGFENEFGSLKPCLHGSDAHSIDEIGRPCAKRSKAGHKCAADSSDCDMRYCWIKADPTFEGLKQTLYEPKDRVAIHSSDPTPSKSQFCIKEFGVEDTPVNSELHVRAVQIPFNKGLVAITGGRGSGKTALVDLLANCFVDRSSTDDKNSFVRRVKDSGAPFGTNLTFWDGPPFKKSMLDGTFVQDSKVVYIAQGELEQYIGEGSDLNEYVHGLIFGSFGIKNSVPVYEYESLGTDVTEQQALLDSLNEHIDGDEQATAPRVLEELKKAGTQAKAEVGDLAKRVIEAEKKLTAEKIAAAEERQKQLDKLKATQQVLTTAKTTLQFAAKFIATDLKRFSDAIKSLNTALAQLQTGTALAVPEYPDTNKIQVLGTDIDHRVRKVLADIATQEADLRALAADQKEHATLLNKQKEAESRHTRLQKQWTDLSAVKQNLTLLRADRTKKFAELLKTVLQQKVKYDSIITTFSQSKDEVLKDLDFRAEISNDEDSLRALAEDLLDKRQTEIVGTDKTPSIFVTLLAATKRLSSDPSAVEDVVTETDRLADDLRGKVKGSRSGTMADLYRMLYRSYLSVAPSVRFRNTPLDRLSLGQKATVLMKIYLAEGDNPIIIDSHDDHLDNESIMDELVGSIRQAKQFRQVILASNNGNVVINSDADQLVIAKRNGIDVEYVFGSLENADIRSRALKVLEGGRVAFKRRQDKYRLGR